MRHFALIGATLMAMGCGDDPVAAAPPETPDVPRTPTTDTDTVDVTVTPDTAEPPDVPDVPDEPDVPSEPDVPDEPDVPSEPDVPDTPDPPPPELDPAAVAHYFAPIWFQDSANGGPDGIGAKADVPTTADYDGDLQHDNNWDHLPGAEVRPALYWALVATTTHYFLTYAHYHPRDWEQLCTGLLGECHEGDLEEIQIVVQRAPAGAWGDVLVVRTHHHGQTTTWTVGADVGAAQVGIDGTVDFAPGDASAVSASQTEEAHHVRIYSESKGHGIAPCKAGEQLIKPFGILQLSCPDGAGASFPGGDGLVLTPAAATAEVGVFTEGMQDSAAPIPYALVPIDATLWQWRSQIGDGQMFADDGAFTYTGARAEDGFALGDTLGARFDPDQFTNDSSSGRAPWNLDMAGSLKGDPFFDPAYAYSQALVLPGAPSLEYVYHPYLPAAP